VRARWYVPPVTSSIASSEAIEPDVLWVTDITRASHPQKARSPCPSSSGAYSRRVVGSVDRRPPNRGAGHQRLRYGDPEPLTDPGTIGHADHGTRFTSWAFTSRVRDAGLLASMGNVGDALDNAVTESFGAQGAGRAA
jgi:putative transposase